MEAPSDIDSGGRIPKPVADPVVRNRERAVLRRGYHRRLERRVPFNDDVKQCEDLGSAWLWSMENEHLRVPSHLSLASLGDAIHPSHRDGLRSVWEKLEEMRDKRDGAAQVLMEGWINAPAVNDGDVEGFINDPVAPLREEFRGAVAANVRNFLIPEAGDSNEDLRVECGTWKSSERSLRQGYFVAAKNYCVALRLWYEMLLQKPGPEDAEKLPVLPLDHPGRAEIALRNRYLRIIDATHDGVVVGRSLHHNQREKRVRKTREVPYIDHPIDVLGTYLLDVVPYVVEESTLPLDLVMGVMIMILHDLGETTQLSVPEITETMNRLADRIDTNFNDVLAHLKESGFWMNREQVIGKMLHLVSKGRFESLLAALKILSNNTEFSDQDCRQALIQNISGSARVKSLLHIDDKKEREVLGPGDLSYDPPLRTFEDFPDFEDDKLDGFLMRLHLFTSGKKRGGEEHGKKAAQCRQLALIAKILDRADNNKDLHERNIEYQRPTLRATVVRLVGYTMLDYDQAQYPLYNALPRLIDVTVEQYDRFARDHADLVEDFDRQLIKQLRAWQAMVRRYAPPETLRRVTEAYVPAQMRQDTEEVVG